MMDLRDIKIYRITHIDNIPHILQYGITHRNSPNANPDYKAIGDSDLISTRASKAVVISNGQSKRSTDHTITLGDFIPFYFGIRMPMLYVIQHGGNFVPKATPPSEIVYIACSLTEVIKDQPQYYFSNGHATEYITQFYDKEHIELLPDIINWNAVQATYWGGPENLDLRWQKQAEFLAANDIAPDCFFGFLCYDEAARQRLIEYGISPDIIKVYPKAYY